jgi:hypothetical protein
VGARNQRPTIYVIKIIFNETMEVVYVSIHNVIAKLH